MQLRKRGEEAGSDIVRSLESLCKVWSHSEDSQLSPPHICNILTVSHHENERPSFYSGHDSWEPVSTRHNTSTRNVAISVGLIGLLLLLLIIAIYLAIKHRKKTNHTQVELREYEFDNLSRDQLVGDKYQDGPPDYYAAVLQKTFSDDS